jgi:DNA mismatch repair protein MutS2
MPIAEQTLHTLEFAKIRDQLAQHTAFSASRELALTLLPATDLPTVRQRLATTSEACDLLGDTPEISIGGARDVRRAAQHAARGGILDGTSLLEVASTLSATRLLRTRLVKLDPVRFPLLIEQAAFLPSLQPIEDTIFRAIGDDGDVLDSASPALGAIRREIRVAFARLQEKLNNLIANSTIAGALQEPIITVRNGRYVIPVKADSRRVVRGLVHDQSSSGATLYIEPMATVDLNNRWREYQAAEAEEIQRILAALSDQVGNASQQIVGAVETLAQIDFAFARAKYAAALRCVAPEVFAFDGEAGEPGNWGTRELGNQGTRELGNQGTREPGNQGTREPGNQGTGEPSAPFLLTNARHPLLDQRSVVPTTLWLGGDFRLLLITGPNTGGKTVALKTAGLLALMAQAGLHIPADAPSRLPVFGHIFADIGDEQSIEQSLSTFSSHMTTIISVLRALEEEPIDGDIWDADRYALLNEARPLALVLFDELGAGTDPVEGAALARAIIERLLELEVYGIATTHYAELKAFAYNTPGVQNASVEFNVETLAPTYRLSIGLPGRSNALAIATRLGLDPTLVERARSTLAREDAAVEDLLAGIHKEREATSAALQRAEELRTDAEIYRQWLDQELREFQAQREQAEDAARQALDDELREVRTQLRRLRDEFRSVTLSRQWLEEAEQRMQTADAQVRAAKKPAPTAHTPAAPAGPRPIQPGDTVLVRSVGLRGEVVSIDPADGEAQVQVGGFRMTVNLRELSREKASEPERPSYRQERSVVVPAAPDVSMSFDMRGWRASEVADKLDRYLNDAYLAGLAQVRIIHGKGTGALRQVVRDVLQGHPLVNGYSGGGRDGGDGVTVASLVER